MGGMRLSQETKGKVWLMYETGVKNEEIANFLGISSATVILIARDRIKKGGGVPKRSKSFGRKMVYTGKGRYIKKDYNPNRKLTQEQEDQLVIDYFENNLTYKQVMEKYDVWQTTVRRIVNTAVEKGLYEPKRKTKAYRRNHIESRKS